MSHTMLHASPQLQAENRNSATTAELQTLIDSLASTEIRTYHVANRLSRLLHEAEALELDKARQNQGEVGGLIMILNSEREQSRYGFPLLWQRWWKLECDDDQDLAREIEALNEEHAKNGQAVAALWRQVRDLSEREKKALAVEESECGSPWTYLLRVFSGFD